MTDVLPERREQRERQERQDRGADEVRAGSLADLQRDGRLLTKVGSVPVVVFWYEDRAWAIEDRCPHMGFPLHQGTVDAGLLTCHWHHAQFDLESGCTLDLWADDARAFDVRVASRDVLVSARPQGDPVAYQQQRLQDGLDRGLSLVISKAVLGLLDERVTTSSIVSSALEFGIANRAAGWGGGLTVLVAMANVLGHLDPDDRALALVHALSFLAGDTTGRPRRIAVGPLATDALPAERLSRWYRRLVDTRSGDGAERVLASALSGSATIADVEGMMFAAVTDHVFIDGGHTVDFTNKAFEALEHVGAPAAPRVLPTLARQTAGASRAEETSPWRHPRDLVALVDGTVLAPGDGSFDDVAALGWSVLADDPDAVVAGLVEAAARGASAEQLGRAVAYAAALRITRFHVQNDFGDWDQVHHAFTAANALHQALVRNPTPALLRGLVQVALRVYLDRFLNVPAARLPTATDGEVDELAACWDIQGEVDRAGGIVAGFLRGGGDRGRVIAALGHALLAEDAGFHWYQVYEAAVRQALAWPDGSEESTLILCGVARFLAAHTPTRRELPTVVQLAARLRRGDALFAADDDEVTSAAS
jgi:nitrite reductase/ring-hydroxylating ferredoxin subunit